MQYSTCEKIRREPTFSKLEEIWLHDSTNIGTRINKRSQKIQLVLQSDSQETANIRFRSKLRATLTLTYIKSKKVLGRDGC